MLSHAPSMDMEMVTFQLDSVVHTWTPCRLYKNIWSSMLGKELECMHATENVHDLYAVAVVRIGTGTIQQLH